jgi:predicted RNA-binding protein associated with RNAse of E/G family
MKKQLTVRKLDHMGQQVTAYPGRVLQRDDSTIVLRTSWDRAPLDVGYVLLEPGDRWAEHFYADRWYNIFEIRSSNGRLKGWYCNVTRPARITADEVSAEDLALDLWVVPDGEMLVLDEDEFAALSLSPAEREAAQNALAELQAMVAQRMPPFDSIRSFGQ